MPEYTIALKELSELYAREEYRNCIIQCINFTTIGLSRLIDTAHSYLGQIKCMSIFRKKPPRFIDLINESSKLGIITSDEKLMLIHMNQLRNEGGHDLFFEKKALLGEELEPQEINKAVRNTEQLFFIFRDRADRIGQTHLEEMRVSIHETNTNLMFSRRSIDTLHALIEKEMKKHTQDEPH
jgi:hypothetical protein